MERTRAIVRSLAAQQTALVVLPDLAGGDTRAVTDREFLPLFTELSAETDTLLVVQLAERDNGRTFKTVYLIRGGALLAAPRHTPLSAPARAAACRRPPHAWPTAIASSPGRHDAPARVATAAGGDPETRSAARSRSS